MNRNCREGRHHLCDGTSYMEDGCFCRCHFQNVDDEDLRKERELDD